MIEPPGTGELGWIQTQIRIANILIAAYSEELSELEPGSAGASAAMTAAGERGLPTLRSIATLTDAWFDNTAPDRLDINGVVNAVGIVFGEHVRLSTGLSWVIATDDDGHELALHGNPGEMLIYPQNLVAKRFVAGTRGFVEPVFFELVESVLSTQKENGWPPR